MKIIVDTNILISAALNGSKAKATIDYVIEQDNYDWIVSAEKLNEYKAVLVRPKFKLSNYLQQQWFELIDSATTTIKVNLVIDFPRDKKDAKFLACVKAVKANYLIIGYRDFSEAQKLIETKIITAKKILELFE